MNNKELNRILKSLRVVHQDDELSLKIINRIRSLERRRKFCQLIFSFSLVIMVLVNSVMGFKILQEELKFLSIYAIMISLIENWQLFWDISFDIFWALWENIPFYGFSLLLINLTLLVYIYRLFKNFKFFKFLIKIQNGN